MGDRCYVEITVRACDMEKWEQLGFELSEGTECYVDMVDSERNYGVSESRCDLVPGCPMYGHHYEGGDYAATLFAYDGETFMSHEMGEGNHAVIPCGPKGPSQEHIDRAKQFHEFSARVEKMVLGEDYVEIGDNAE